MKNNLGWTRYQAEAMAKSFKVEDCLTAKAVAEGSEWAVLLLKARKAPKRTPFSRGDNSSFREIKEPKYQLKQCGGCLSNKWIVVNQRVCGECKHKGIK